MKTTTKKEENRWINVHDDTVMREMGFMRPTVQSPRDKSVWTKTPSERRMLRKVKTRRSGNMHFLSSPKRRAFVRTKLIIQLKRNKKFPKTTYSFMCWNTDVDNILRKFQVVNTKTGYLESVIAKYSYNGKLYSSKERSISL